MKWNTVNTQEELKICRLGAEIKELKQEATNNFIIGLGVGWSTASIVFGIALVLLR